MSETGPRPAWPPQSTDRLAEVVAVLAEQVTEQEVRTQLHALSGLLRNLGSEWADSEDRRQLERDLAEAVEGENEDAVIATMRRLASMNRSPVKPVDWTAASGG